MPMFGLLDRDLRLRGDVVREWERDREADGERLRGFFGLGLGEGEGLRFSVSR